MIAIENKKNGKKEKKGMTKNEESILNDLVKKNEELHRGVRSAGCIYERAHV